MNHAGMTLDHEERLRFLESLERPLVAYGSCWGREINWSQASATANQWYAISDTDMTDGRLYNVTHDGSGKLTLAYTGDYLITYSVAAQSSISGKLIQSGIRRNAVMQNDGIDRNYAATANVQFHLSSVAILTVTAGQTIEIAIRTTDTGSPTLTVDYLNLAVVKVG